MQAQHQCGSLASTGSLPGSRQQLQVGFWASLSAYHPGNRARWGTRGALNPKTSHAGLNPPPEGGSLLGQHREQSTMKTGSCAAGRRELGQVRKEAALSGSVPGAAGVRIHIVPDLPRDHKTYADNGTKLLGL